MKTHAVIKVRSNINVNKDIRRTMELLRLNRVNHCIILHEDEITRGMLQKIKDYVTWGEVKPEVLARMVLLKGRLIGNKPLDTAYIKANSDFKTPLEFAKAVVDGKVKYSDLKDIKPIFRLHPPIKGYEGIKRAYKVGGALGYRGEDINDLIIKMLGPETAPKAEPKATVKADPKKAPAKKPVPKKPVAKKAEPKAEPKKAPVKKAPAKKTDKKDGDE